MSKNLIIKIANGFGNQMFLYASAYAFSKKLDYNLLIDDETGIKQDLKKWQKKKRINWKPKYELGSFELGSNIACHLRRRGRGGWVLCTLSPASTRQGWLSVVYIVTSPDEAGVAGCCVHRHGRVFRATFALIL